MDGNAKLAMKKTMSKEAKEKGMENWMNWSKKCGKAIVDLGNPIAMPGEHLQVGKNKKSDLNIGGYTIIQAKNLAEAKAFLKDCPHAWHKGCSFEVFECMPIQF